jgi:hypothetical protein
VSRLDPIRYPWAHRRARVNQPASALPSNWRRRATEHIRPFAVAPLARRLGIDPTARSAARELALRLGIDRRWIYRYRDWGLTLRQADQWAARAGVHPAEVWPIWDDLDRLRGAALRNAASEQCPAAHPYDGVDSRGYRTCSTCKRDGVRQIRAKKSAEPQVTALATDQEAS